MEIVTNVKEEEWKKFLNIYTTNIYCTPEWKKFLENTFGYKPYYLFAIDERGKIIGLLPLFYVKSKLTGNRLCSVPFSHICGTIGNVATSKDLVEKGIDLFNDLNADILEIREYMEFDGFQHTNTFFTHTLELSSSIGNVWQRLDKGSVRWAIKKSQQRGITVETTKIIEDIKEFYELNCETKREIGVPCHPWKFFKNLFNFMGDNVSLYVAKSNNEIIAGGIMEYYKDTVIYGYGAADSNHLDLYPYNAFIWKSIEDASKNGYIYYDFGRTSYANYGLINFKKRWGTIEKKLYYSSYPGNHMSLSENRDNFKYRMGTKAIRNIPMSIYKKFSDVVFGHFG